MTTSSVNPSTDASQFNDATLSSQRWRVLLSYSLLIMNSTWIWITWSPIATLMTQFWQVQLSHIDALAAIYLYFYVPGSFLSTFCVKRYLGLHWGLLCAAGLNVVGAWVRLEFVRNYRAVCGGTLLCALGHTMAMATLPLIATKWFGATEKATVCSVAWLASQMGVAVGLGATVIVSFGTIVDENETIMTAAVLARYLRLQMAVGILAFWLIFLFGRGSPPTPPSVVGAASRGSGPTDTTKDPPTEETQLLPVRKEQEDEPPAVDSSSYLESVQLVLSSSSSIFFAVLFGVASGVFYTIPVYLSQLTPPHWHATWNGWLGMSYQGIGIMGSLGALRLVDATQQHGRISVFLLAFGAIYLILFAVSLYMHDDMESHEYMTGSVVHAISALTLIAGVLGSGLCLAAWNPVGIEWGTKLLPQADEWSVFVVLESSAKLFAFLWVTLGGILLDTEMRPVYFMITLASVSILSVLFLALNKGMVERRHGN